MPIRSVLAWLPKVSSLLAMLVLQMVTGNDSLAEETSVLADALLFHASFDKSTDAEFAKGDNKIYTSESLQRENVMAGLHSDAVRLERNAGRFGGSLAFAKKSEKIIFFQGPGNLPTVQPHFQGTFSFWLRLTPDEDLPAGFVDPLQITDKKWNDASFFVDFSKDVPRTFRLGVFSDYAFWNPGDRKWEDIGEEQRPLVTVTKPPFSRDHWTHVGITFHGFNQEEDEGEATLYLNGESQGSLRRKQRFTWGSDRLAIMLGIYYVGQFDDFAIFNRALTADEVKQIFRLPNGIHTLRKQP